MLFWFRRDLRVEDNAGLFHAAKCGRALYCAFVFDREILDALGRRPDRRVDFIRESIVALRARLRAPGGELIVVHGFARREIPALAARLKVGAVFANGDYEPAARARDGEVQRALEADGRKLLLSKDQALFEKDEIRAGSGRPYAVFTPYRNAWMRTLDAHHLAPFATAPIEAALAPAPFASEIPALPALGFEATDLRTLGVEPGTDGAAAAQQRFASRMDTYHQARDLPAMPGGSGLSVHHRFGTQSIRASARLAHGVAGAGASTWLSELCWRDFFFQVLWHNPRVAIEAYRLELRALPWPNDEALFAAWCAGGTGYPLVDAGMRELAATGTMHNRVRMVVASLLTKDLLVDWRWGERHFAAHLLDYDQAANNGNWQWAAGTGCDAQPWFRIFNPVTQSRRFDADGTYIRRHVPELARVPARHIHAPWLMPRDVQEACGVRVGADYPAPIVDHAMQRAKALALYKRGG